MARWTAVVCGAVIHGIEKSHHSNVVFMRTSPRSFGIVLDEAYTPTKYGAKDRDTDFMTANVIAPRQITWLVKKGDVILSDEGKTSEKAFTFPFQETGVRKFGLPIYEYEDDDLPDRFQNAREGEPVPTLTM
jgi:hypothetical protein